MKISKFARSTAAFVSGVVLMTMTSCSNTDPKLEAQAKVLVSKPVIVRQKIDPGKVDILFIIDDSGSMGDHQRNLVKNINRFVNKFFSTDSIDYHIGVISTDDGTETWGGGSMHGGMLQGVVPYIDPATPDKMAELTDNLIVGTSGSGTEKVFKPLMMALTSPIKDKQNVGFLRPDAYLAIIVITDADDQSENISPKEFYDFLVQLKGSKDLVLTYSVIVPSDDLVCPRDGYGGPIRLESYMKLSGGITFGLCDTDYGKKIGGVSQDIYDKVSKVKLLNRAPVVSTIRVRFGTQEIPENAKNGWSYDPSRVALVFGPDFEWTPQPIGTSLDVEFKPIEAAGYEQH